MKTLSTFGSPPILITVTLLFYLLSANRIKAISFTLYTGSIVYVNAMLKNIYHDPRPFMEFAEIKAL